MTRVSGDEIRHGRVWNGFDYELQVWVSNGIIQCCRHPDTMHLQGRSCCNAYCLAEQSILNVSDAHRRDVDDKLTEGHGLSQTPSRKAS
jgi:hypothetical protein